jgi:hypothetical protein
VIWKATTITTLRLSALSAALNLCQDFLPAQGEAISLGVLDELGRLLSNSNRTEVQVALRLLQSLRPVLKDAANGVSEDLISQCIIVTASAPRLNDDPDDFITCLEALMEFLRDSSVQKTIGTGEHKSALLDLVENIEIRVRMLGSATDEENQDPAAIDDDESDESDESSEDGDTDELVNYAAELVGIAGEVALHWDFLNPSSILADEDVQDLINLLQSEWRQLGAEKRLFTSRAAALMLGNIARTDSICDILGTQETLLKACLDILRAKDINVELRHAVAGLLANLAIEYHNKDRLRETDGGVLTAVCALLETPNDDLRLDGLRLLRHVLRDSKLNCEDFVSATGSPCRKAIEQIAASEDVTPKIQTEAGRVIIALYRTTAQNTKEGIAKLVEERIQSTELISVTAISLILRLSKSPDPRLKSECWIGLALVSKTKAGATVVLNALKDSKEHYMEMLESALAQDVTPEYPPGAKDKENILLAVNYLLENGQFNEETELLALRQLWSKYSNIVGR